MTTWATYLMKVYCIRSVPTAGQGSSIYVNYNYKKVHCEFG